MARLALEGLLRAGDGSDLRLGAVTVCVHSDTPGAIEVARAIRARLDREGVAVRSFAASAAEGR